MDSGNRVRLTHTQRPKIVVALILVFAYVLNHQPKKEKSKIFELVAGAGNNYAATEAPPPSMQETIKFDLPEAPAPVIRPEPIPEIIPEKVITPAPIPKPGVASSFSRRDKFSHSARSKRW